MNVDENYFFINMERFLTPETTLRFQTLYPMTYTNCVNKRMNQTQCEQFIRLFILQEKNPSAASTAATTTSTAASTASVVPVSSG